MLWWLVLHHLTQAGVIWEKRTSIEKMPRLVYGQACGEFSWLIIDVGGLIPPGQVVLGAKKPSRASHEELVGKHCFPWPLLVFLRPGNCPDFPWMTDYKMA